MKNNRGQALVVCLFVLIGLSITAARASGAAARFSATMPIEFIGGLPTVKVEVNGVEADMLLDTGSNAVAVTDTFVKRAGLITRTVEPAAPQNAAGAVLVAHIPYLLLGPGRIPGFDSPVIKSALMPGDTRRLDGVLGCSLFDSSAGLIDLGARRLTLWYPAGLSSAEIKAVGMNGAKPVPLVAAPDHLCHIAMNVGRSKFEVLLDTGSERTSITPAMAAELKLRPIAQGAVQGVEGIRRGVNIARCPVISVGSAHFGPSLVEYAVLSDNARAAALGMSTLRYSRILIDPGAHQIRFAALPGHLPAGITPDWSVCRAPMRLVGERHLPVIGVELPDHKLHWFGVTFNEPNLIADPHIASLGAPGPPDPANPGATETIVDLIIGGHTTRQAVFVVAPPEYSGQYPEGFEGFIGVGLLAKMAVKIDPSSSLAEIIVPGPAGLLPPPPASEEPVGFAPGAYGYWYMKAWLDGAPVNATPDLSTSSLADFLGADQHGPSPKKPFTLLNPDEDQVVAGRFQSLRIGDFTMRGPEVLEFSKSPQEYFLLGFNFFRGRSFYLDAPIGAIYMTRTASASPPALDVYQGTGIASLLHKGPDTYVGTVLLPSPASEAGIQAGDQILAIDGIAPGKLPPLTLDHKLWSPDGKPVVLKVKKKGQPQPVEAKLVRRKLL